MIAIEILRVVLRLERTARLAEPRLTTPEDKAYNRGYRDALRYIREVIEDDED